MTAKSGFTATTTLSGMSETATILLTELVNSEIAKLVWGLKLIGPGVVASRRAEIETQCGMRITIEIRGEMLSDSWA